MKALNRKKPIAHYSKFEKKDFLFVYLIIAIPVLQFAVFWFYVNISSITLSFKDAMGNFTFANFKTVIDAFVGQDMYGINLSGALGRSFLLWCVSHLICFPISIITTYILFRRIFGHYVWRICYIIPSLMGSIIWCTLIQYMVHYNGAITQLLIDIGVNLPEGALNNGLFGDEKTAFPTIVAIVFIMGLVGNNAVLTGAFSRVPDELFESAQIDGAGFWRQCFSIAIPCVWSTISTLLTFALCSVFTMDYNIWLLSNGTGQPEMSTIGFQIFNLTYRISNDGGNASAYGYPAALGVMITLITLPVVLLGRRGLDKLQEAVEV